MTLRAPFPWFGGKSRAAHLVWAGFGAVANYVEPFAGSLAVLLGRPTEPRIETVNDLDCYLANFWRAVKYAPDEVAEHADWPVNEADLHARHRWLVEQVDFRKRMRREPKYFDAQIAGWWVWGLCQWIGSGWCWVAEGSRRDQLKNGKHPDLHRGHGVHSRTWQQKPEISGSRGAAGRGVHASGANAPPTLEWIQALAARLRRVRVCCGDWKRVLGRSATESIGVTAVLLDPPYAADAERATVYAHDSLNIAPKVREWALANGKNPKLRIALCGYEGEHDMPSSWECVAWKAVGGYAASAGNTENAARERIWFSPHCNLVERQLGLFDERPRRRRRTA